MCVLIIVIHLINLSLLNNKIIFFIQQMSV